MRLTSPRRRRLARLLELAGTLTAGDGNSQKVAVALVLPWFIAWQQGGREHVIHYLLNQAEVEFVPALQIASRYAATMPGDDFSDCRHAYLYEELLAYSASTDRRRRGVYYTPPEIVQFIVGRVDDALVQELGLADGLAHAGMNAAGLTAVRILDPATGSGVFLAEVIRSVHGRLLEKWRGETCDEAQCRQRWNDYVPQLLIPRLAGWEIMPLAALAAQCLLAQTLSETGYNFVNAPALPIEIRDALTPPDDQAVYNVVLGNPPYASLSSAAHGWIESLIQSPEAGYMTVDGQPLGERKHWLHDDYVKFIRLAQWHVEQSGSGIVGFVTNHGYLENASFRGMRASLLRTFAKIDVIDLHGNAKMLERSPDGSRDENVFGIASGAAIGVFVRPPLPHSTAIVQRADLWGTRAEKLARLESREGVQPKSIFPTAPDYRFLTTRSLVGINNPASWRICDAMPINTTAPVTARDGFVVAFTRKELIARVEAFRDLSIPDEVIRGRFFGRTRSSKYPRGDSRSWKLGAARRVLAADPAWQERILFCQYRPLDYRHVLWHDSMIDWPRREVLRNLLKHENRAIIARRQSPRNLPANFFWATKVLTTDGIIRSDNRGSESLFPVWHFDDNGLPQANFAPNFVASMEQSTGLTFCERYAPNENASSATELTALSLAGYIYGLFWSTEYRTQYQHELSTDFPLIVLPHDKAQFLEVSQRGAVLLQQHTAVLISSQMPQSRADEVSIRYASGFPRCADGQVWVDAATSIAEVSAAVWELRIGAHQVARKWLHDRRKRGLTPGDIACYRSVLANLGKTCLLIKSAER